MAGMCDKMLSCRTVSCRTAGLFGEAVLDCVADEIRGRAHAHFCEDSGAVGGNGLDAEEHFFSYGAQLFSRGNLAEDLEFALGKFFVRKMIAAGSYPFGDPFKIGR